MSSLDLTAEEVARRTECLFVVPREHVQALVAKQRWAAVAAANRINALSCIKVR